MTARESTNSFWGYVQQKGPWKSTPQDIMNAKNSRGYAGKYDRVARPYAQGYMPPPPPPTSYSIKSITNMPLVNVIDRMTGLPDPIMVRNRELQEGLLKAYGMDQKMALMPMAGAFSRTGPVLNAYAPAADTQPSNQSVADHLNAGYMPVQQEGPVVHHTEDLDYIMDPTTPTNPIPVFNGVEMYEDEYMTPPEYDGQHPMGPEPNPPKKPYPREPISKRPNSDSEQGAKKPKGNPKSKHPVKIRPKKRVTKKSKPGKVTHLGPKSPGEPEALDRSKRKATSHRADSGKRMKHSEKEHKPVYNVPKKKRSVPIKKNIKSMKSKKREMVSEDVTPATAPAVRPNLKRKGTKLEQSGKVRITKDTRPKQIKAKSKPNLKVNVRDVPKSKQSHTKPKGVRAEDKSAAKKSDTLPHRTLRKK